MLLVLTTSEIQDNSVKLLQKVEKLPLSVVLININDPPESLLKAKLIRKKVVFNNFRMITWRGDSGRAAEIEIAQDTFCSDEEKKSLNQVEREVKSC